MIRFVHLLFVGLASFSAAPLLAQVPQGPESPPKPKPTAPDDKPAPAVKSERADGKDGWITRSYQFPSPELSNGFDSKELGSLRAPRMPGPGAAEAELSNYLKKSHGVAAAYFATQGYPLPEGSLLVFDPKSQTLAVRTTADYHELLVLLAEDALRTTAPLVVGSVAIVETEAGAVRRAMESAATTTDHAKVLEELSALVDQGKGRRAADMLVESRSGQRVRVCRRTDRPYTQEFSAASDGSTNVRSDHENAGTDLQFDPDVSQDGKIIDINLALDHDMGPPRDRWEPAPGTAGNYRVESRVTDFHKGKVNTALSLAPGTTRLVAVWKQDGPAGAAGELCQAAFLTVAVRRVTPLENPETMKLLQTLGEKVMPTPKRLPALPQGVPPGMILRRFRVNEQSFNIPSNAAGFMSSEGGVGAGGKAGNADPFSSAPEQPKIALQATVLEALRAAGLSFPEGAAAMLDAQRNILLVRNTPENVEAVRKHLLTTQAESQTRTVAVTLQIIEGDGAFVRRLMAQSRAAADNEAAWKAVQEGIDQKKVKVVGSAWIDTRSGQRALSESRLAYTTSEVLSTAPFTTSTPPAPQASAQQQKVADAANQKPSDAPNKEPAAPPQQQPQAVAQAWAPTWLDGEHTVNDVGLRLEIDPVIGDDNRTVDLNLALNYDFAPPSPRLAVEPPADAKTLRIAALGTDFHEAEIQLSTTYLEGSWRLAGVWKPDGTPDFQGKDILQAAFVRVNLIPSGTGQP